MGIAILKYKKPGNSLLTLQDFCYILSQMPPNTEVSHVCKTDSSDAFNEFLIYLKNPIFKHGAVITEVASYTRTAGYTRAGSIHEFNASPLFDLSKAVRTSAYLKLKLKDGE